MNKYETILVVNPKLDDEGLQTLADKYRKLVEANAGQVDEIESWGKREIAQTLGNEAYGYYLNFNYQSDNSKLITIINQQFRLDGDILKFQTHRVGEATKKFKVNRRFQALGDDYTIGG